MNDSCPDCGASVGEMHELYCSKERCPFCGGQLVTCGCLFTMLDLNEEERKAVKEYEDDTVEPLLGIGIRWEEALERQGRIPFGSPMEESSC